MGIYDPDFSMSANMGICSLEDERMKMDNHILVVEDDAAIREGVRILLEGEGYIVQEAEDGYQCLKKVSDDIDLVILDIMMPGSDGLSICKKLRTISSVPIIILTAKDSESDHMKGFMYGGDDYLIKPFSPSLLVVRVNALFRRVEMNIPVKADISFGDVCFSWEKHNAIVKEHDIGLTMTEFSLLGCLMEHGGTAIPRNEILDKVWGIDSTEIETRVVDETAFVVLNGNYALAAGFSVGKDALAYEKSDSEAAKTYVNVIAVKEGNENSAKIKALVDVLKSDDVKKYINDTYDGAVLPYEE